MQCAETTRNEPELAPREDIRIERAGVWQPDVAVSLIEEYYEAASVVARDDRAALLGHLSDSQNGIWVAYCGSAAVGCILYKPLPKLGPAGEIKRLYVRPEYRGRGIASLLLNTLEQFALQHDVEWLYLDTKDDLTEAIAFYRRRRYTTCARYNENPQATIFMRKRLSAAATIRTFQPGDEEAFRTLNEAWIAKYFRIEEKDRETLSGPHSCVLAPGGQIFMALRSGQAVGCCALLAMENGDFEVAKMAVAESERGKGIGRKLLEYAIDYAKARPVRRLYIETNSKLANAIHLYESVGFRHIPRDRVKPSPYARADVYMEMILC